MALTPSLPVLAAATASLREHDLRHPALRPPRRLVQAVLAAAASHARGADRVPLAATLHGRVDISEQAVAAVVHDAARDVAGVRSRRCRIDRPAGAGSGLRIQLRTAVAPGVDIRRAMDLVRRNIREAVAASVGVVPGTVHLTVEDLYDD
ncbi:hypothetical protein KKR91_16245 [Arthrobacter jiangjiafuii]|uniref:Asp23/Gls24 family envelope stress response protein n=1 Tax=Arthrobacter jiangjiafuii TaxID=2817475 RepID=A0A975M4S6_9MICC|nr:hypothetical protein [Arthrobacter jiangjiafuii]MBP3042261.1 hypothetical protein [Arthrobacter jiangjiafuii]QWC09973.1 hypothetical protein KKR91_16245 [Arthrobacter jiangjiafuii]